MLSKVDKSKLAKRLAARPRNRITPVQREEIAAKFANGCEVEDLAREYKCSRVTIYKWIKAAAL